MDLSKKEERDLDEGCLSKKVSHEGSSSWMLSRICGRIRIQEGTYITGGNVE